MGFSTNGMLSLVAAAHDPRITLAVAVGACGDWPGFVAQSPLGLGGAEPFDPEPGYAAWLAQNDPINHPGRLVHAAVLMVNGDRDHAIPLACAERTADVLRAAYAAADVPERFRFVVIPGGGHETAGDARWEALGWIQRWLVQDRIRAAAATAPGDASRWQPPVGSG
jgi:alpha-beta hydrolase superfamily lysophospholipase